MLDVTQPLTVGPNERLTDRSESHPRDLRGPGELPRPPPSRRWGLGGGRAAGGGAGASRPAPSHPVWPGRRRNCGPSPCHPAACPACPEPCPHPVMTLRPSLLPLRLLLLLLLRGAVCRAEAGSETESPVRTLQVETLVEPPEPCAEPAAFGDTLHIHYSGSLVDGRIFDTSLSRDPLVIELGQKQVIPGLEQSLLDMCVGEKRRVIIPSHLAYGKRGFPPSIPADAELHFDVELIALIRANYWQKLVKGILPLVGMAMVPALLGLIGYHLYRKASSPKISKKKLKEEKRNKSKKK